MGHPSMPLVLALSVAGTLHADIARDPQLDAKLQWAVLSQREQRGTQASTAGDPTSLPILVRFAQPPTLDDLTELERDGALVWRRRQGRILGATTVFLAHTSRSALALLTSRPEVARVELDWSPIRLPPLDITGPLSQVGLVWQELDDHGQPLTGAGVTIADLDSGVDISHPALFHRQEAPLEWHDGDGGGYSGEGGEWVDLDGDGARGTDETLRHVEAFTGSGFPGGNPHGFTPGLDWLYADSNGNGVREEAPLDGWGEDAPSLGEPLLTAEIPELAANLDPNQPLFRLGRSKVRAVRGRDGAVHRRGVDLLEVPADPWYHGTPVAGILVGGEPGFTRLAGMAPDAELVIAMIDYRDEPRFWVSVPELAAWAAAEAADVILVEDGEWAWEFMDGSSAGEVLLAELARDRGIIVLTAAGNLAGKGQHDRRHAAPGDGAVFDLRFPAGEHRARTLWLNLNWRGKRDGISWRLDCPMGSFAGSASDGPRQLDLPGGELTVLTDTSTAGTQMLAFRADSTSGLEAGSWLLTLSNDSAVGFWVDAFKYDDLSSWSGFGQFADFSDAGSVTWPATAHGVIVVGGYSGRIGSDTPQGELNSFSGRGVALDGRRLVDLVAPGSVTYSAADSGWTRSLGSWFHFGGTSAALAHAAGVAALLRQAAPEAHPHLIERAIKEGARADVFTGAVPNEVWGYGKLDAAKALARLREIRDDTVVLVDPMVRDNVSGRVRP